MSAEQAIVAAPWRRLALAGAGLQGLGLGVDAWLHVEDPGLAARESPLTLANAGHALFAIGFALTVAGVALGFTQAGHRRRFVPRPARRAVAAFLGLVLALSIGAAGISRVHVHDHAAADDPGVAAARARAARILPGLDHDHALAPDLPQDPASRQRLAAQLVDARAVALRYPTVADAEAAG